jgi:nucleoside-diphosphate kinase
MTGKSPKQSPASKPAASPRASDPRAERTFIMIKPDGVQRGIVGEVIARFERKGFKIVASKMMAPNQEFFEKHYADLKGKPFFNGLVKYMCTSPVVALVFEGLGAAAEGRKLLGATKPSDSAPGTIRGDLCMEVGRNIVHGSDSPESAKKEIELWFPEGVCDWTMAAQKWVYEI